MRKSVVLGTIAALGMAGSAMAAEGFSYNLVEGSYIDLDGADGFGLAGSVEFTSNVYGVASVQSVGEGPVDATTFGAGVGLNFPVADNLDLFGALTYERIKVEIDGLGSDSEDGFGLAGGIRGRVLDKLELTASLKYTDFGGGADDTALQAGARWYFTEAFAVGADIGEDDTFALVLRYDFGNRL